MRKIFFKEDGVIPMLETEDHFTLILHQRDFVPGRLIISNIEEAVTKSRRMIMLLSRYVFV